MTPDLFDYLDYRAWLEDWFKAENEQRKAERRVPLTHRVFHELAGISNVGTLIQILEHDRRLTPALLNSFLTPLEIDPGSIEERYLSGLIDLESAARQVQSTAARLASEQTAAAGPAPKKPTSAGTREPRRHKNALVAAERAHREAVELHGSVLASLRALRSQARATPIAGRVQEILGSLLTCAVLEMARAPDFVAEVAWVEARLEIPATILEIESALAALRAAKVLTEQGILSPVFRTSASVPAHTVERYYPAVSEAALRAMGEMFGPDRLTAQQRQRLGALTVAIPAGKVPELDQLLLHLQNEVAKFLSGLEGDRDVVYQIYLHLFPLSKGLGDGSDQG